jgi:hypothetical protein
MEKSGNNIGSKEKLSAYLKNRWFSAQKTNLFNKTLPNGLKALTNGLLK